MEQSRIDKTLDNLRGGGLPTSASAADNLFLESINGSLCSGCGEAIKPRQYYYSVRLRGGAFTLLRLHPVCYDVWARFEPKPAGHNSAAAGN
jgi:hypothetical protein